jgi:erythromycin esterase-like protein
MDAEASTLERGATGVPEVAPRAATQVQQQAQQQATSQIDDDNDQRRGARTAGTLEAIEDTLDALGNIAPRCGASGRA